MGWFDKGNCRYFEIRDFEVISFLFVEVLCFYIANVCLVEI